MDLTEYIRDITDFPEPGVVFKDSTPLLKDANAFQKTCDALYKLTANLAVDKVVGIESRGFIFAPILAAKCNAGFVPIRKKGKLPFNTVSVPYSLEYGTETLEIHTDAIAKGERVLVHDDVLATGGTARAACSLIEQLGGIVVQCTFLIALSFLNGAEKLKKYPVQALVRY